MKNFVSNGDSIYLPVTSGAKSGDYQLVGGDLTVVLITDADADDKATCQTCGVINIVVTPEASIAVGDAVYDAGATRNENPAGVLVGYALEAIDDTTATSIPVLFKK